MKPPACQFYFSDFLIGTMTMSAEEVGAYIRLLCYQWDAGGLPDNEEQLIRMAGCSGEVVAAVRSKFPVCSDGRLRNERMEIERQKQADYRARQARNGRQGAESRWHPKDNGDAIAPPSHRHSDAIATPQPKHGSPSPSSSSSTERGSPPAPIPSLQEWTEYAASIGWTGADVATAFNHYEANGWKQKGGNRIKKWQAAAKTCRDRRWANGKPPPQPTRRYPVESQIRTSARVDEPLYQ